MPYLIDGHNLIPKMGLKLADLDDEMQLIELLQAICRLQQSRVEIYFDGANPGQSSRRDFGRVIAHFVRKGNTADAAIEMRLRKLGRDARTWSVVSSDKRVQSAAREVHAKALSSDEFARLVAQANMAQSLQKKADGNLSEADVSEWMDLFNTPNNE